MQPPLQQDPMKPNVADYETLVGDVHDLRAFALVVDLRSLTAAAKLMGESKATMSRRITRLESALRVSLLHRTPRVVEPTEDGAAYRVRVGQILELLADANAAVRKAHATPTGHLRVTVPPGFDDVLAPLVTEFVGAFPDVVVSILVAERFVDLEAEHIDVALRATAKLADSSLVAHRLIDVERIVVAAPSYLRAHGAPRRVEDLAHHKIVRFGESRAAPRIVLRKTDGTGSAVEVRLPCAVAASDVGFAKELVVVGAGIGVLPRVVVQRDLDARRLDHLFPSYGAEGSAVFLLHRGGRFLSPKTRAFRDFMVEAFAPRRRRTRARAAAARALSMRG